MNPKTIFLTLGFGLVASAAHAESDNFNALDADNSNGLSFAEALAVAPNLTALDFAKLDSDTSGELSKAEFAQWKAAAEKKQN